jgi:chromosome segregation ATPase
MTAEDTETGGNAHDLRALLVRLLIEAAPADARLTQLITALEKAQAQAGDRWRQELATLRADLASLRQGMQGGAAAPLEELLTRSDAKLAAQLEAADRRAQQDLARLSTQVSTLTERVSQLEAQLRRLRGPQDS